MLMTSWTKRMLAMRRERMSRSSLAKSRARMRLKKIIIKVKISRSWSKASRRVSKKRIGISLNHHLQISINMNKRMNKKM
jgi:DUF4097 and DUF4098 domain-containing protein YvlB